MRALRLLALLVAMPNGAPVHAANVARISVQGSTLTLHTERGVLSARRPGVGDAWRLVIAPSGPLLDLAAPPRCDVQVWATADTSDPDATATVLIAATRESGSLLVALRIDHAGRPAVIWSHDWTSLPALGRLAGAPTLLRWRADGPLEVLLGNGWPREPTHAAGALLRLDAVSGRALDPAWTSDAALPGEITALDADADGAIDRLYLADAAMRLWRLDARAPPGPEETVRLRPLMLARLDPGLPPEAAFIHAPDVALVPSGDSPTFSVAIASSDRPRRQSTRHALVVVRDPFVRLPPTDADQAAYRATSWNELADIDRAPADMGAASRGYRLALDAPATGPTLTVGGKVRVATGVIPPCTVDTEWPPVALTLHTLPTSATPLTPVRDARSLALAPPDARLDLEWSPPAEPASDAARCTLDGVPIAACGLGPRVMRRYWLRRDAP